MRGPGRQLPKLTPKSSVTMQRHAEYAELNDADAEEMHAMMSRSVDPRFTPSEQATAKRLAEAAAKRVMKKRSAR